MSLEAGYVFSGNSSSPAYACAQGTWAGQSCFPLSSLLLLSLSSFPHHLLPLISNTNSSFINYLVSIYYVLGSLPPLRTKQNKATSLHSSAAHLKLPGHLTHLGILPKQQNQTQGAWGGAKHLYFYWAPGWCWCYLHTTTFSWEGSRLEHSFSTWAAHRNPLGSL